MEGNDEKSKASSSKRAQSNVSTEENLNVDEAVTSKAKSKLSSSTSNKKRKKRDSGSSDEERWLTAIESGKLEDVDDELKKIKPKDPALMTARQRAIYDKGSDTNVVANSLISLPSGYKEKVMSAEAIQKAAIKSQKRKQLADEKREKDKKKTMERLLKKQDAKMNKPKNMKGASKSNAPSILYKKGVDSTVLCIPLGFDYPLNKSTIKEYPKLKYCSLNCGNLKKYSCSKTGADLCSIECFKKNISNRIL